MRALMQRVTSARVEVDGRAIGQTGPGLLILVCAMQGDSTVEAEKLAQKIHKLRIFRDEAGKMNLALKDTGGACAGCQPVHAGRRYAQRQPPRLFHRRRPG